MAIELPECEMPGCRGEGFARTTFRLEILDEGHVIPEWLPAQALQAAETVICVGCLKRSVGMGDRVGDAILDAVGPLLKPSVPAVRLVEPDERTD